MNHDIKIQKYDHIDVYAKNKKCPICKTKFRGILDRKCYNGCYVMWTVNRTDFFEVFDYDFVIGNSDREEGLHTQIEEQIAKEIFYWKENDRYLMKIMTNEE